MPPPSRIPCADARLTPAKSAAVVSRNLFFTILLCIMILLVVCHAQRRFASRQARFIGLRDLPGEATAEPRTRSDANTTGQFGATEQLVDMSRRGTTSGPEPRLLLSLQEAARRARGGPRNQLPVFPLWI
jgi:hypothetical protein